MGLLRESTGRLVGRAGEDNKYQLASEYLARQVTGEDYVDFLTLSVTRWPPPTLGRWKGGSGLTWCGDGATRMLYDEITEVGSPKPASKL